MNAPVTNNGQPILSVRGLCKNFGALAVAQSIDLDLASGARVGLIGPNGAGKTTFVNMLTGMMRIDSGTVDLDGQSIVKLRPEMRVRRGLARTHQINTLLLDNTARENVAIAVAERDHHAWTMMRFTKRWRGCLDEAQARLDEMDIGRVADRAVRHLPYGEQRLLEIAIAMALKPRVLLLDEPGAGVPSNESHVIHEALDRLPADMAIMLIEHDMDLVFRFAREIVVLVQGKVLVRGEPAAIAANPEVRSVYLGRSRP